MEALFVSNINISRYHDSPSVVSSFGREPGDLAVPSQYENMVFWQLCLLKRLLISSEFPVPIGSNSIQQILFLCDCFDVAIAAHVYKHQHEVDVQQGVVSHGPSISDAEETCNAFSFQKNAPCDESQSASRNDPLEAYRQTTKTSPFASHSEDEV